jgi:hypothetical protein
MMRPFAAPLLALTLVVTADAQTPLAFSERDRAAAVTALCGAVTAGTARDEFGGRTKATPGFLTQDKSTICVELLAAPFRQAGRSQQLIVLGGHRVAGGVIDHGLTAQTDIHVGVLELRSGRWQMTSKAASLAATGYSGRNPVAALRRIGSDRHALELRSNLWNDGRSVSVVDLYDLRGAEPAKLLHVVTDADDCALAESCFAFEGAFNIDARPGTPAYDAKLDLKGNYRNPEGRIAPLPANASFVFRLVNGAYTPVLTTPARRALWNAVQSPWNP